MHLILTIYVPRSSQGAALHTTMEAYLDLDLGAAKTPHDCPIDIQIESTTCI